MVLPTTFSHLSHVVSESVNILKNISTLSQNLKINIISYFRLFINSLIGSFWLFFTVPLQNTSKNDV